MCNPRITARKAIREVYVSERNHSLACVLDVTKLEGPLLTVELCCKWYTLYLIHPTGAVERVSFEELEDGYPRAYVDHVPQPAAVRALVERRGWYLDAIAEELIEGRWKMEVERYD